MTTKNEKQIKRDIFLKAIEMIPNFFDVQNVSEIADKVGDNKRTFYYNIKRQSSTPSNQDAQELYNAFKHDMVFNTLNHAFKIEKTKKNDVNVPLRIEQLQIILIEQTREIKKLKSKIHPNYLIDLLPPPGTKV